MQEEDEEPARGSGIAKMLELSGCSEGDSYPGDGEETETGRLSAALEELQAQNTMLQDELTLLSNVKGELEADLERIKEEFQMEREELEFKINELQLNREGSSSDQVIGVHPDQQGVQGELQLQSEAHKDKEDSLPYESKDSTISPGDQNLLNAEELKAQCEALTRERDSALAECQHMRNILQGFETELSEKTKDFVLQYKAMKEQGANTVRELQDKIKELSQERDDLSERVKAVTEEKNTVMKNVEDLNLKLEGSTGEGQKLQYSVEEQAALACELKQSVEELTRQNEEILSQLQMKENVTQDLKETVNMLTEERDKIHSQLKHREEEMQMLNERAKEIEKLVEEKEKELQSLTKEKEAVVQHLKDERENTQSLKEEMERRQESVLALELAIKDLSTEKADLHQKLEEGSSKAQEARELLGSKLAALEAQLELETSQKNHLESKLKSLAEEAEQARATIRALEENQSEILRNSYEGVEELQARVDELEKERSLLRSSLEEAQGVITSEEVQRELQARITDLEQERNMLKKNLEEVVKDAEGLQKDLEDMKSANEKVNEENKKLLAHISLVTQEKEETEKGEMENVEKERRELKDQLTEKDSLISQLRTEMASLQVSGAPDVSGSF